MMSRYNEDNYENAKRRLRNLAVATRNIDSAIPRERTKSELRNSTLLKELVDREAQLIRALRTAGLKPGRENACV